MILSQILSDCAPALVTVTGNIILKFVDWSLSGVRKTKDTVETTTKTITEKVSRRVRKVTRRKKK